MAATALAEKPKSAEQTAAQTKWFVRDNCFPKDKQTDPKFKRVHDIEIDRDGNVTAQYTFFYGKRVEMPVRHATKFANLPGFTVWDETGKLVEPLRVVGDRATAKDLKPHETIATYAELSTEALVARCRRLPNGAAFHARSPRPVMIDFLMSGGMPPMQKVDSGDTDMDAAGENENLIDDSGDEDGDAGLADGILSAD